MKTISKAGSFTRAVFNRRLQMEFEYTPVSVAYPSIRQMRSLVTTEFDRIFPKPSVRGLPSVIQIEPVNICNLECPLCPCGRGDLDRSPKVMNPALFKCLMDEIGGHLSFMVLWWWGEPLLHPDLPELIRAAKKHNIAVITSTNGQRMDSELAEELVASGLDSIIVALDGATEASYRRYRVGGVQEKVVESLNLLKETKRRLGSSTPLINMRTVVTKDNEHEVGQLRKIASRHGADLFTLRGVGMTDLWDDAEDENFAPVDHHFSMYRYSEGKRIKPGYFSCRRPWKRATVFADGSVVPCEMDYTASQSYGTYSDDGSFSAIWNGSRARAYRKAFLQDRMQSEFCRRCPMNDRITEDCTVQCLEVRP